MSDAPPPADAPTPDAPTPDAPSSESAAEPVAARADDTAGATGDPIDLAWRRVEARFSDDDAHTKLLSLGSSDARLGEVVALYKRVVADTARSDADRALARKKMESAAFIAVQMMEATKTKRRDMPRVRPGVIVAAFVTIALGGLLVWAATHR